MAWVVIIVSNLFFSAQATNLGISEFPLESLKVLSIKPQQARMGKQIIVEVDGLSKAMKLGKEKFDPEKLILYFDGYPLDISAKSMFDLLNISLSCIVPGE